MKTTKLAKELPRHKSYPRYVAIPTAYCGLPDYEGRTAPKMMVRLTCGRFITPQRWNELAQQKETFEEQFAAAKAEADAIESAGKREYATVLRKLAQTESAVYGDDSLLNSRQLAVAEYNSRS